MTNKNKGVLNRTPLFFIINMLLYIYKEVIVIKLKGYVFDTSGKQIKIADNLTSEQYQRIWDSLQTTGIKNIRGYLILKEEDDEQ